MLRLLLKYRFQESLCFVQKCGLEHATEIAEEHFRSSLHLSLDD